MSSIQKILVIGSGELGKHVLSSLATHPSRNQTTLSVLLRPSSIASTNAGKAREITSLRDLDINLIPGDIVHDPHETLVRIFRAHDTIIGCVGFAAGPGVQVKLTRAVLEANVARYIPWQFGVDYDTIGFGSAQDLFDEQLEVRQMLRSQNETKWVIISTGMFTSFLFESSFGVVDCEKRVVTALGSWNNRVTVTAPEDIGRITAEAVLGGNHESVFGDKPIFIAGDTLSYARLVEILETLTACSFAREVRTVEAAKADLAREPDNSLYKYQVVFGQGRGVAWDLTDTWNRQVGIDALTAEQWAKLHLKLY